MRRRDLALLLGLAIVTRGFYAQLGVSFDASTLETALQFLDPVLLQDRLLESLIYFHAGPPMLNLIAGVGLKVFGDQAWWFYASLFHLLGYCLLIAVFHLVLELTDNRFLAWLTALIVAINPAFVGYQNWLMYTFIACALLTVSAWALLRFLKTGSMKAALLFFICTGLLVLTRSLFHFYWYLLVIAVLMVVVPYRRQILLAAAGPVLVCLLWYGKNLAVFDSFSSSSLLGLSLNNVTTLSVPRPLLEPHVANGTLSQFALISRYLELEKLLKSEQLAPQTGIPALDENTKSSGGFNYNSLEVSVVARLYLADAINVGFLFPQHIWPTVVGAQQIFFSPASENAYWSRSNREAIKPVTRVTDVLFYGASPEARSVEQPHFGYGHKTYFAPYNTGILLVVLSGLLLIYGLWHSGVTIIRWHWQPRNIVIGYIWGCLLLLYLIGGFIEFSENNRYRFIGEPLFWVLLVTALHRIITSPKQLFESG